MQNTQLSSIEDHGIDALVAMVVRLSEMTFRPLYYKLYNWACGEDNVKSKQRKLTFFKMSTRSGPQITNVVVRL